MEGLFFQAIDHWSYLGLIVILLAAGLGLPLPEDIPLLAGGWLVHRGHADLTLMICAGLFGVMVGDSMIYYMGRRYGLHIVEHRWFRRFAKPWLLEKARDKFARHGAKIIFAARFMPGLRAVLFLTAGTFRVPYWKFATFDGAAALVSVPLWVWVGATFSGNIEAMLGGARTATVGLVVLLVVALAVWGLWEYYHYYRRKGRAAVAGPSERLAESTAPVTPQAPVTPPTPPAPERPKPPAVVPRPVAASKAG